MARSDWIVRALVFVALPSIVWLFVLSGAGTVFFVLSLWPSVGSVVSTKAEISNLGATLFVLGFFSVGPAGLWALVQLVRVLRVRLYEGREGLQHRRRTLVVGLCVGIVPLVYLLWKATVDRYGLTTETPAPGILLWLIASGWPLVPLLVYLMIEASGRQALSSALSQTSHDAEPNPPS